MKPEVLYPFAYDYHNPQFEIENGYQEQYWDTPERVAIILAEIEKFGHTKMARSEQQPESDLLRVHTKDYVQFIKRFSQQSESLQYPSVFPRAIDITGKPDYALLGYYSLDLGAPIGPDTYLAAKNSADVVISAANRILDGQRVVYALCRPPGHHAEKDKMGGYCYFNNAAIAADILSEHGTVAILDLDVHHGNGTQRIFYKRADVLTVSIHAHPKDAYPGFSGFENEMGEGNGIGFNLNIPLPKESTGNEEYDIALNLALRNIEKFSPNFLVVSLGLDTYIKDPMQLFKLTTEYYKVAASQIARLKKPTLIVQEGGYFLDDLGINVASFLNGFQSNTAVIS